MKDIKDVEGKYRMFQGKRGTIYLQIGNQVTGLFLQQINDLQIESRFYDIPDFDPELYADYYLRPIKI